jgi:hypothetical protein
MIYSLFIGVSVFDVLNKLHGLFITQYDLSKYNIQF